MKEERLSNKGRHARFVFIVHTGLKKKQTAQVNGMQPKSPVLIIEGLRDEVD